MEAGTSVEKDSAIQHNKGVNGVDTKKGFRGPKGTTFGLPSVLCGGQIA